jgi:hypothetical protein
VVVLACASMHCEDCHFSGYFLSGGCLHVGAHTTLQRCTVQVGVRACSVQFGIFHYQWHASGVLLSLSCGQRLVCADNAAEQPLSQQITCSAAVLTL